MNHIKFDLGRTGKEGVDRIHLAQDRDQWRVLMNAIINFWFE